MPTRAPLPATPCAMSSALDIEWLGTNPSARAATASRLPATMTRPSRRERRLTARPVGERQPRVARASRAILLEGSRVRRGRALGVLEGATRAELVEEEAIRGLRPVRKRPRQRMHEDERPAPPHREGVAPLTQRMTERDAGGGDRVQRLARQVRADPRHADDESVERLVESDAAEPDRANHRFRMRHGRQARERGGGGERSVLIVENPAPHGSREQRVEPPKRRGRHVLERGGLVRVAAKASGEARMIEDEGHTEQAGSCRYSRLDGEGQLPGGLPRRLHERARGRGVPDRLGVTSCEERSRPAVNDALGR